MSLINFESVTRLFRHSDADADQQQLLKEVLLMVLARATSADTHVDPAEVSEAQRILAEVTGEQVSAADIQTAAQSAIFERQSLDRYLTQATKKFDDEDRVLILSSLIRIIRTDEHVREFELDYFDRVAHALKATPSEIAGLRAHAPRS